MPESEPRRVDRRSIGSMSFLRLVPENFRQMIERGLELWRADLARVAKRRRTEPAVLEVELGEPLSDAELDAVQSKIGFSLDPRFVALFRSVNGFRIVCGTRCAHVQPLRELIGGAPNPVLSTLYDSKILGGVSGSELQTRAHPLGTVTDLRADYFQLIAVFANATHPDPVALLIDDYGAVAGDHRPVRARDLLWLLALRLDLSQIVSEGWFEGQGYGGNHPIVDLDLASWELPSALDHEVRGDYLTDVLLHLKGVVGLKGWLKTPPPVRWFEDKHAISAPADLVAQTIDKSLPGHTWDIDYNRAILELVPTVNIRINFEVPKRIPKIGSKARSKRVRLSEKVATSVSAVWKGDADANAVKRMRELAAMAAKDAPKPSVKNKPTVNVKPASKKPTKSTASEKRSGRRPAPRRKTKR